MPPNAPAVTPDVAAHAGVLAGRLTIPAATAALLFDMDGVLLDTLTLDFEVVNDVLRRHMGAGVAEITRATIRAQFALDPTAFWHVLLRGAGLAPAPERTAALIRDYEEVRRRASPPVHDGILDILGAARAAGLRLAVVSNNPEADVAAMLGNTGLLDRVDVVVGNDRPGLARKPAPDAYLEAARVLGVEPRRCVVIEDSLLGAQAGRAAGCHTVGVATGAASVGDLAASPFVDAWYPNFSGGTA